MIIYFIYTKDVVQKAVKRETSLLAERRRTAEGAELLDELVMDEEYDITFKALMNDAHAEIILNLAAHYLIDTPTDMEPVFQEFPDFRQDRDFNLWLNMHADWPTQYRKAVDIKLLSYIIDYICYRWLETKSPNDAQTYYSRLDKTIDDVKRMLTRKTVPLRRYPSFP